MTEHTVPGRLYVVGEMILIDLAVVHEHTVYERRLRRVPGRSSVYVMSRSRTWWRPEITRAGTLWWR